jgi:glycosyltransferase involved in cell wall biosynthesis
VKLLHVIPYVSPRYGGPVTVLRQTAPALVQYGMKVDVVSTRADGRGDFSPDQDAEMNLPGAQTFLFSRSCPGRSFYFAKGMARWIGANASAYDVIHIHGVFNYPANVVKRAARACGVPYLVSPHGMLDRWCMSHRAWKKWPYFLMLERSSLRSASGLLAASEFEAGELRRLSLAPIYTLPFGIPATQLVLSPPSNGNGPLKVIAVARLDPIKGLETLIETMASLKARGVMATAEVIGGGDIGYRRRLEEAALRNKAPVQFIGELTATEVQKRLRAADVFVLPSYHENFSFAVVEALAAGLPVVITDQVGIADSVISAQCGAVVPAGQPEALACAIEGFRDTEVRRLAGERARQLVVDRYATERYINELLAIYEAVC